MRTLRIGTYIQALTGGRIRHVRVETITDQDDIQAAIYRDGTPFTATREPSTKTRGTLFEDATA